MLLALHSLGGRSKTSEATEKVASFFPEITDADFLEKYPTTGYPIFRNRVAFSREKLKQAGLLLSDSPRGVWELSEKGKKEVALFLNDKKSELNLASVVEEENLKTEEPEASPSEILQQLDPFQFERLCGQLFEKLDFENVEVTQRSGDGGIDGRGDLILGLVRFQVVFQAKKYATGNTVGAPDVQKLAGAKQQFGAEKAVFITTSAFSRQAKEAAQNLRIELINGDRLVELLQKFKIGFVERTEYDIDPAFFKNL